MGAVPNYSLTIDEDFCKGCGICVDFCPKKVFGPSQSINPHGYPIPLVLREGDCTGCRLCELLCPDLAIVITERESRPQVAEGRLREGKIGSRE